MKKKYILVLTFLLVLCGQVSYGQRSGGGEDYQPMFGGDLVSQMNEYDPYGTNELYEVIIQGNGSSGNMSMSDAVDYYNWMHPDYNGTPDKEDDPATDDFCTVYPDLCEYFNPKTCTLTCEGNFTLDPDNCACICNLPPKIGYIIDVANCEYLPCTNLGKANLANIVYDSNNGLQDDPSKLPSNVTVVPPPILPGSTTPIQFTDSNTGFNSALYRVDNGNGNIEYVYATTGTADLKDLITDVQQAGGFTALQYQESVDNAIKLQIWAKANGYTLSFTGHSLGGGLANANALATGLPATIYNPAGLNDATISNDPRLLISNSGNVTAYVVRGEPVDFLNSALGTPVRADAANIHYIGSSLAPVLLYGTSSLVAVSTLGGGAVLFGTAAYTLHAMSNVTLNLDCN